MLEKTLENPLDCKKIKPVGPKGNQPWIFIGRTDVEAEAPVFGPPPTPWSFNSAMKLSWHLWVRHFTCWFRIKSSLSAILVPLGIGLCCVLGPCHSFGSCALPLFLLLHNECSGLISFKIGWFELVAVQGILKSLLQHHSSKASIFWYSAFFIVQLSHPYLMALKKQTNHSFK